MGEPADLTGFSFYKTRDDVVSITVWGKGPGETTTPSPLFERLLPVLNTPGIKVDHVEFTRDPSPTPEQLDAILRTNPRQLGMGTALRGGATLRVILEWYEAHPALYMWSLAITRVRITPECVRLLANLLTRNPGVIEVSVTHCGLNDADALEVARAVVSCGAARVRRLDLSLNLITGAGLLALARLACASTGVHTITVGSQTSQISDEEMLVAMEVLRHSPSKVRVLVEETHMYSMRPQVRQFAYSTQVYREGANRVAALMEAGGSVDRRSNAWVGRPPRDTPANALVRKDGDHAVMDRVCRFLLSLGFVQRG